MAELDNECESHSSDGSSSSGSSKKSIPASRRSEEVNSGSKLVTDSSDSTTGLNGGVTCLRANASQSIDLKKGDHKGSPLTNSVQENFKGFSYMGESVNYGMLAEAAEDADDDNESAIDDEETQEMNSEDEYFDERPGGRYKGKDHMDDDVSME